MKKNIKFLACLFAISALAIACNNTPEETTDTTTQEDTVEAIDSTPAVDTTVQDTVVAPEEPAATKPAGKKPAKVQKRTDVNTRVNNSNKDVNTLREANAANPGSNALRDNNLQGSDNRGGLKTRNM